MPPETSEQVEIFQRIRVAKEIVHGLRKSVKDLPSFVKDCIISCEEEMNTLMEAVDVKIESIFDDLHLVKRVMRSGDDMPTSKLRVPEPKPFEGARSSKVLENFL